MPSKGHCRVQPCTDTANAHSERLLHDPMDSLLCVSRVSPDTGGLQPTQRSILTVSGILATIPNYLSQLPISCPIISSMQIKIQRHLPCAIAVVNQGDAGLKEIASTRVRRKCQRKQTCREIKRFR
jgi:hypothetical protein